jgi:hypothetical protein
MSLLIIVRNSEMLPFVKDLTEQLLYFLVFNLVNAACNNVKLKGWTNVQYTTFYYLFLCSSSVWNYSRSRLVDYGGLTEPQYIPYCIVLCYVPAEIIKGEFLELKK